MPLGRPQEVPERRCGSFAQAVYEPLMRHSASPWAGPRNGAEHDNTPNERSPSADIYIILPEDQAGDTIMQDILADMPGIVEVPWAFELDGPAVPVVRKGSSHEALITFMATQLPGEIPMTTVKAELDLKDSAFKKLKEVLGKADHPMTTALRDMGVRYVVTGNGRGAKSYLMKDRSA
jgi:hypothetical protein